MAEPLGSIEKAPAPRLSPHELNLVFAAVVLLVVRKEDSFSFPLSRLLLALPLPCLATCLLL